MIPAQNVDSIHVSVELLKLNVLYSGIDNPVHVTSCNCITKDLKLEVDKGQISGSNGSYIIKPSANNKITLIIHCKDSILRKIEYRVLPIPDPIVKLENYRMLRTCIHHKCLKLMLHWGDCFFFEPFSYKITSFLLTAYDENGNEINHLKSDSDSFTDEQYKLLFSIEHRHCLIKITEIMAIIDDKFKIQLGDYEIKFPAKDIE